MVQTTTGFADMGDAKLYYEVAGAGKTLVLVHAGFVDGGMWDDQWDAFAAHYRVIRFDMRGYGKSTPVNAPVSRRKDLYSLLKQLGVTQTVLLGCSMGGQIAIDFALEHPEMISALVAVSAAPSGFQMQGPPPPDLLEMIGAVQQGDLARASELQIRLWVDGPHRQPDQVDPKVRQRAAAMNRIVVNNGTWAKADANPTDPLDPPAAGRLGELHIPTLIMAGALDNSEIVRAADVTAAHISGSQKVILEDCAHVPNMEKPNAFNETVLSFLNKVK